MLLEPVPDKIEKQGTLLNSTCSLFGTRCTAGGKNVLVQYAYLVNEPGAKLSIQVSEKEAIKNQSLYMLLHNKTYIELNEPLIIPSDIGHYLKLPIDYKIPSGIYKIKRKNNYFEIQLIEER